MKLPAFVKYRERTIVGASVTMVTPTGQFDPGRLVNPGAHRWGFKPETGVARRLGKVLRKLGSTRQDRREFHNVDGGLAILLDRQAEMRGFHEVRPSADDRFGAYPNFVTDN